MKIKSITDVITNSSSEVFVIRYRKSGERKDIIQILTDLFNSLGLDINEYLDWKTESKEKGEDPIGYGIKTRKGDLIIVNDEYDHKWLLPPIQEFISTFDYIDKSIVSIQTRHG